MAQIGFASSNLQMVRPEDIFYRKFTNGGSDDMGVDGSTTSVEFTLEELDTNQKILLHEVSFVVGADEIIELDKFGNVTLINGVLFTVGDKVVTFESNTDVHLFSTEVHTETAGNGSNTISILTGHIQFKTALSGAILVESGDLKITIQDDMSGIEYFKVSASGVLIDD